jgi:hypothetical protein
MYVYLHSSFKFINILFQDYFNIKAFYFQNNMSFPIYFIYNKLIDDVTLIIYYLDCFIFLKY